ncbi:MAG: site-specific integrase [Thomasclavelia ramosa]|nr:site-specific integrase [Thomasclavelia ramosa]
MKWKDISLNENYIFVNKTMQRIKNIYSDSPKTIIIEEAPKSSTSSRKIPIPGDLISLFRIFHSSDDCYLLTGRVDRFVEPRSLERKFRNYIKTAGIKKANFHMLRHTFATMCIEGGFEIKCLSEILGHSGSQITLDRYVHSSFDLKKSWIDKFSNQNITCH